MEMNEGINSSQYNVCASYTVIIVFLIVYALINTKRERKDEIVFKKTSDIYEQIGFENVKRPSQS